MGLLLRLALAVAATTCCATTSGGATTGRVSGWTGFESCGDKMCTNMTRQIAQITQHADTIHTIYPYVGGAAQQYQKNHSVCSNGCVGT